MQHSFISVCKLTDFWGNIGIRSVICKDVKYLGEEYHRTNVLFHFFLFLSLIAGKGTCNSDILLYKQKANAT